MENLIDFRADLRYPVTKIGLHLILFEIFIMFSTKIFTNNIKTSKVLVRTDNIITSLDQLLKSEFVVCFFEDHIITEVTIESPKTSILRRLFDEKDFSNSKLSKEHPVERVGNKCIIRTRKMKKGGFDFTGKALFINELFIKSFIIINVTKKPGVYYWQSEKLFEVCIT